MALSMRLSRGGSKKRPYYKIVVADARAPRDGKFIERIGSYNPLLAKDDALRIVFDTERAKHWIAAGAQPSDRVARFLDAAGVVERKAKANPNKGEPGQKAKDRAEDRATKLAEAEEAKAAAAAAPVVEEVAAEEAAPVVEDVVAEAPAAEEVAPEAAPEEVPAPAEEPAQEEAPVAEEAAPAEAATEEAPAAEEVTEEKAEG